MSTRQRRTSACVRALRRQAGPTAVGIRRSRSGRTVQRRACRSRGGSAAVRTAAQSCLRSERWTSGSHLDHPCPNALPMRQAIPAVRLVFVLEFLGSRSNRRSISSISSSAMLWTVSSSRSRLSSSSSNSSSRTRLSPALIRVLDVGSQLSSHGLGELAKAGHGLVEHPAQLHQRSTWRCLLRRRDWRLSRVVGLVSVASRSRCPPAADRFLRM